MPHFNQLPSSATLQPTPFKVNIPDSTIDEFKVLVKLSKLPPDTYENTREDGRYGVSNKWIRDAKMYWETKFDWKHHEAKINSFPQYMVPIHDTSSGETINIHFVALFSSKPDAIPVLLFHGWPGSFLEFLPMLDILQNKYTPETLPYHIVVPSLPGYAFSELPTKQDTSVVDVGRWMNELAIGLGFGDGYVLQGGDLGSRLARVMTVYPGCKAVHLNMCFMSQPPGIDSSTLSKEEIEGVERSIEFKTSGSAYAVAHATRPATIGIVLSSSPIALLAWIGEKFLSWSDEDPPMDAILESASLYWFTNTISRSLYPYRESFVAGAVNAQTDPRYHMRQPLGYSLFPKELAPIPRAWVATTGPLVWFRRHEKGGHFAALERPEALLADLEEFIGQVWVAY